ncbi:hypothetical protein B0T17DRAFT_341844 [Bombardia bombarda]|uniref:R3H domain-containing protein n=1 Tax=Bombardia bombarda TaxID=252184 RepID=A0AA39WNC3_9PEZI|nr:hypothetical protein B0T17DRAFT_341844 [Bombardia bombarda]
MLSPAAPEFVPGRPVASATIDNKAKAPKRNPPKATPRAVVPKSTAPDLPTRIQEDIQNGHYECVICTNDVVRSSHIWSCSICWTVAHLHCVRKWHTNQTKKPDEDQPPNANKAPGWRCPGCNSSLLEPPGPHHCWCGKEIDPRPIAGLPPHTCGQTCSKVRATCPHPCPLMCHAGPCPPCTLMGPTQTCFCGKHITTKRCTETEYGKGWSCKEICGDLLPCGEHACSRPCHSGLCGACEIPVLATCYCGKEQKEIPCDGRGDILESFSYGQLQTSQDPDDAASELADPWFEGSFRCGKECDRKFDCGIHACQKACHPQDEEVAHCPFSPDVVTHCPCGKTLLESLPVEPRQTCQDPVSHCDETCNKTLVCGHQCQQKCHDGPCAICTQTVEVSCRCGRVTSKSSCLGGYDDHPWCFRVCRAQLNCGRHECGEHCCPGEKKAAERRKQKRNTIENYEAEHICLQVCGRQLKCGKHTCQQLCHKGPCPSCPEAIFDEISCSCGRTVLQPPQPCGTKPPECRFQCRKARACGHDRVPHQCHPEEVACPNCPFLVEKSCICGKKMLKNQPCWFEEVRCGLICGKKLKCGTHYCKKSCHRPGQCEDAGVSGSHCAQACGKVRKSCEHTCTDQCHAPYPCKEDKPCQSKTFITCPCQNKKQEVRCLATKLHPSLERESTLKCDDDCARLQRNRRLAEALNIDFETHADEHVPYSDATLKLFRDNVNWAQVQEREFRVFAAAADEKRLRFKPMPPQQRAFLHSLAEDFGLDSESQDPEPHRHVCIFKTPRFVSAPRKTLAQCLRVAKTAASLGAAASSARPPTAIADQPSQALNAFLLTDLRFALTLEEVDQALAADLAAAARSGPALTFTSSFLPSDEIVIKTTTPKITAASIATSPAPTPQVVERIIKDLRRTIAKTVARLSLAGGVVACHADSSLNITRKEGEMAAGAGGWNAVASRGSWRRPGPGAAGSKASAAAAAPVAKQRAPRSFLALLKKKKPVVVEEEPGVEKAEEGAEEAEERSEKVEEGASPVHGEGDQGEGIEEEAEEVLVEAENDVPTPALALTLEFETEPVVITEA